MSARKPDSPGDNNEDPIKRAEIIREVFGELMAVDEDQTTANTKFRTRRDKAKSKLKALGFKTADWQAAYRVAKLKDTADNADKQEDRDRAARDIKISVATFTECYAAVEEKAQLDFNDVLSQGDDARKEERKAPEAVVKTNAKSGAKKGPTLVQ